MRLRRLLVLLLLSACPRSPPPVDVPPDTAFRPEEFHAFAEAWCFFNAVCLREGELDPAVGVDCFEKIIRREENTWREEFFEKARADTDSLALATEQFLACDVTLTADAPWRHLFLGDVGVGDLCITSGWCSRGLTCLDSNDCGHCEPLLPEGAACTSAFSCEGDLICDEALFPPSCQPAPGLGEACDEQAPHVPEGAPGGCADKLVCEGDDTAFDGIRNGICRRAFPQVGDPCTAVCRGVTTTGLVCEAGRCVALEPVALGESCDVVRSFRGLIEDGGHRYCLDQATLTICDVAEGSSEGVCRLRPVPCAGLCEGDEVCSGEVCRARPALGEACDGVPCIEGRCLDGRCQLPGQRGERCGGEGFCDNALELDCRDGVCVDHIARCEAGDP